MFLTFLVLPGVLMGVPLLLMLVMVFLYAIAAPFWIGGWFLLRRLERIVDREIAGSTDRPAR